MCMTALMVSLSNAVTWRLFGIPALFTSRSTPICAVTAAPYRIDSAHATQAGRDPASSISRLGVGDELVADARDGAEQVAFVIVQLLTQAVDVDAYVVGLGPVARAPDVLEDHVVGAYLAGVT